MVSPFYLCRPSFSTNSFSIPPLLDEGVLSHLDFESCGHFDDVDMFSSISCSIPSISFISSLANEMRVFFVLELVTSARFLTDGNCFVVFAAPNISFKVSFEEGLILMLSLTLGSALCMSTVSFSAKEFKKNSLSSPKYTVFL